MSNIVNPPVLRPRQGADYISVSLPSFWRLVKHDPDFPRPFKLSANSTAILRADLDAWLLKKQEGGE